MTTHAVANVSPFALVEIDLNRFEQISQNLSSDINDGSRHFLCLLFSLHLHPTRFSGHIDFGVFLLLDRERFAR